MKSFPVLASHPLANVCIVSSSNLSALPFVSPRFTSLSSSASISPSAVFSNVLLLSRRSLFHVNPISERGTKLPFSSLIASLDKQKKKVLIVNTNSGGHAVIGFYLSKDLLSSGHNVTILTVGEEHSDKMKKPPFNRFSELVSAGAQTIWGDPSNVDKLVNEAIFDVVLDNNGKDLDSVRPVADWAKSVGVKQFLFISSAGIYKTNDELPHVEGDLVKSDARHVAVEKYIEGLSFSSWAVFRPQYMIGSGNNKDCEEWFFDRIVRDRPVPIPSPGIQLTNISHVRDLSRMLTLAAEDPDATKGNIFNCVSDRAVTFDGLAKMCAQAAGRNIKIIHYDPRTTGVDAKKAFPFRNMHFYSEPRAAKEILGWKCTTNLAEDLKERYEEYIRTGRDKKNLQFEIDDKILDSLKEAIAV